MWSLEEDRSFKTIKNHGFGVKAMCYLEKYEYLAVSWNNGFKIEAKQGAGLNYRGLNYNRKSYSLKKNKRFSRKV